ELTQLKDMLALDLVSLIEDAEHSMANGQVTIADFEKVIHKAQAATDRILSWTPPKPETILRKPPTRSFFVAAGIAGAVLTLCVEVLITFQILPWLSAISVQVERNDEQLLDMIKQHCRPITNPK
ncbi:MAG: hypothetical protein ACXV7E_02130, partial [Methylobacter sp.]